MFKIEDAVTKKENKKIFYIINLVIIFGFLIFIYFNKIIHKKRKLRKNELNEDFNYSINEEDNNSHII